MPRKPAAAPIGARRFLELAAVAIGIPVGVVLVMALLSGSFGLPPSQRDVAIALWPEYKVAPATLASARAQLREGLVIVAPNVPPPPGPRSPLQPGDEFHRQLQAGILADPGAGGRSDGEGTLGQMQRFVRRGDVLARQLVAVREFGSGWNPFNGRTEAGWQEYIEWCIRLRHAPGEENAYAYSLWRLSHEPFGDSLGLPRVDADLAITPTNGASHIDPSAWQDLLIPLQTQWGGEGRYGERVSRRSWQILPNSRICDNAGKQEIEVSR